MHIYECQQLSCYLKTFIYGLSFMLLFHCMDSETFPCKNAVPCKCCCRQALFRVFCFTLESSWITAKVVVFSPCSLPGADFFLAVYQPWNSWHAEDRMRFKLVLYLFLFATHSLVWFVNQSALIILNTSLLVACSWLNHWDTVDFIWNCFPWECWLGIHTLEPRLRFYQRYCTEQLFLVFTSASKYDFNKHISRLFLKFLNPQKQMAQFHEPPYSGNVVKCWSLIK